MDRSEVIEDGKEALARTFMANAQFYPMNMHLGYPSAPINAPGGYADKHDAWIAQLLETNRMLIRRIEALEKKVEHLMPDKSDDV